MAGNFPFAIDALKSVRVQKKNGSGIDILPWGATNLSPLISLSIDENIFTPLMQGTIVLKDIGDWSSEMQLNAFDEVLISFNTKKSSDELAGGESSANLKLKSFTFQIVNVKNTVDLANSTFQNSLETTKAVTIQFVSKSILTSEFLSSLLEDENFIGPIINPEPVKVQLNGEESTEITIKGFDQYLKEKLNIVLDGTPTWNVCYLKKNNVAYPWGKLKGQATILQTLQYLAENATEYDNPEAANYLFWQDFSGFHFRSINSLISENTQSAGEIAFDFSEIDLKATSIRSFNTLSEYDALNLMNADTYFSWYERIIPDYADPYLDFVDSTDSLIRKKIKYDINEEYEYINHIEEGKLFQSGITSEVSENYSKYPESKRKDDDIYGFFSKNRYNTPHAQDWDYLGISADTRLSNVVWQNQYDLDDEVYPEVLYAYDKLVRKNLIKNREKYVNLKNAKRKWEVYRCSVCCSTQAGGTADLKILSDLTGNTGDYLYYYGPTGIFGDLITEGYGIVAAGAFSDVVNYLPGVTGVTGNGLTLAYDMNSYPYNQSIGEFYHLQENLAQVNNQINRTLSEYQNELNKINPYINRIENDFLPFVDSWIIDAVDLAYSNLTPGVFRTCSSQSEDNTPYGGPGSGTRCCTQYNNGDCNLYGVINDHPVFDNYLWYHRSQIGGNHLRFDFGMHTCNVRKLPLYVNLQFNQNVIQSYPLDFSGHWNKFIQIFNYAVYPFYITPAARLLYLQTNCAPIVNGPMAYELPFQKPNFLYSCSKTKLLTGTYHRTYQDPNFISGDYNEIEVVDESSWLNQNLNDGVDNETIWCDTCLDPIALQGAKFEYAKVLKQLKLRRLVLENIIAKLQNIQNSFNAKYQEFINRKAFFISKNPFDPLQPGNIYNKQSSLNLFNIKSIKRKPIRGSRYEVLAKRFGITSGVGNYVYDVYFGDDRTRGTGITGNHPYYDQKYKTFRNDSTQLSVNYATKPGIDTEKRDYPDAYYYDDNLNYLIGLPGLDPSALPDDIGASLILPSGVYQQNNLFYQSSGTVDAAGSVSAYLPANTTLDSITNKFNIFSNDDNKKPPSLVKEEISSYVRIEFINPIGVDRLVDFPSGFIRDAGSEYFLPYLVQLTAGPNGRQSIQSNVAVIGIDPYGFDVAIKKNKTKNNYSDYKEWGYYWWHKPLNKIRLDRSTYDIHDMSLWSEKQFENEFTYYENNGSYVADVGADFTEYDNYIGAIGPVFLNLGANRTNGAFYPDYRVNNYYYSLNLALNNILTPTEYFIPVKDESQVSSYIKMPKPQIVKTISDAKYGSYNLIGSHLHYNLRRSWYDFTFPSKLYFNTLLNKIANINNYKPSVSVPIYDVETLLTGDDFAAFGGNDFSLAVENSISLKNTAPLRAFLQANSIDNIVFDNLDLAANSTLSQFSGVSFSSQNNLPQLFTDDIEYYLNGDFTIYRPGLLTKDVWKYDVFGEAEYGMTSPPTLPPEYDLFDNNFAAQFVVFSQSNSESSICKKLKLKCLNPKGQVSNIDCPENDPYCNCPAKNIMPKEREPSYKELAIAFEETKECKLIEKYLGKDYLGCILSDDQNVASCNCPEQGKYFPTFLNTIRSNATFYTTPPETPLRRQAQMMMFNAQRAVMTIYPNDQLKVGGIITIKKPNPSVQYKNRYDRVSGKWMVTGISRVFKSTNIEFMVVTLNRDSYYQEKENPSAPSTYKRDIF
jgi:hypothetical protein